MKNWTVGKLIKELQKYDPKLLVIMASDSEGNSFDTVSQIYSDDCAYDKEERQICPLNPTVEDKEVGYKEGMPPAIVLYP